jgi:hypothetical protein
MAVTETMSEPSKDVNDRAMRVRPYALTGGRTRSSSELPIETIVRTSTHGFVQQPRLTLERKRIVSLCVVPISIAEVSAHLHLPLGVARVLVGDMTQEGLLDSHKAPTSRNGGRPDIKLLERVRDGLQAL